ncbi:GNAT family N-acetyltransferase [Nocardia sp. CA-290969]|uniref:GNAT family N-acetyltransferase n=1 Tax=Nocardia sp. CA-290969 TaxID=3239986 RepID=UPI003D8F0F08
MPVDIESLTDPADLWAAQQVFRTAMVGVPLLEREVGGELNEPGRTFGARIGGELVGTVNSYTSWLVVPGGQRVPHAAVTHVGVLPTHARRGIASALLRRQLIDIAERGEIVATLRATQGGIYERFGYGVAGSAARLEIDRRRARFRDTVPESGPVRLLAPADAWEVPAKIYATAGVSWVGAIDRPPQWWRLLQSKGDSGHVAVHGEPGAEDGFVRYHGAAESAGWPRSPHRTVVVDDLVATTPAAYLGLIRHLLAADIVDSVVIPMAAPDAPLRHLLTDERAVTVTDIRDETWLRVVDVAAALQRRAYKPGPPVVSRSRIRSCRPTTRPTGSPRTARRRPTLPPISAPISPRSPPPTSVARRGVIWRWRAEWWSTDPVPRPPPICCSRWTITRSAERISDGMSSGVAGSGQSRVRRPVPGSGAGGRHRKLPAPNVPPRQ